MKFKTPIEKAVSFGCLFLLIFIVVSVSRRCSNHSDSTSPIITEATTLATKQNKEIETLYNRVESLEKQVDSLNTQIAKIEALRNENLRNTPHKSLPEHYRDLSKRYADQKPDR